MKKFLLPLCLLLIVLGCKKKVDPIEPPKPDQEQPHPDDSSKVVFNKKKISIAAPIVINLDTKGAVWIYNFNDTADPLRHRYMLQSDGKFHFTETFHLAASTKDYDKTIYENHISQMNIFNQSYFYFTKEGINDTFYYICDCDSVNKLKALPADSYIYNHFYPYSIPPSWLNGKITSGFQSTENYGTNEEGGFYNYFLINLETAQYIYWNGSTMSYLGEGYTITDLITAPNGNMDTDPIDWKNADLVFSYQDETNYPGKNIVVFIDLDNNTYASFLRNVEDDPENGSNRGRQTLLTTSWQPLADLFVGWKL